jgi:uncharacterized nucleotidyltransferase DUF6036
LNREDFNHVVRAAADAVGLDEFVIIGSQAIHGEISNPPDELLQSMEVDMYPLADPDRADVIDGVLGDGSWFEYTNGYFAHGVGPTTAKAPAGWMYRLVRVDVEALVPGRNPVAYCMERHDMVLAKLVRGAERDVEYATVALRAGLLDESVLQSRIHDLPVEAAVRGRVESIVVGLAAR